MLKKSTILISLLVYYCPLIAQNPNFKVTWKTLTDRYYSKSRLVDSLVRKDIEFDSIGNALDTSKHVLVNFYNPKNLIVKQRTYGTKPYFYIEQEKYFWYSENNLLIKDSINLIPDINILTDSRYPKAEFRKTIYYYNSYNKLIKRIETYNVRPDCILPDWTKDPVEIEKVLNENRYMNGERDKYYEYNERGDIIKEGSTLSSSAPKLFSYIYSGNQKIKCSVIENGDTSYRIYYKYIDDKKVEIRIENCSDCSSIDTFWYKNDKRIKAASHFKDKHMEVYTCDIFDDQNILVTSTTLMAKKEDE